MDITNPLSNATTSYSALSSLTRRIVKNGFDLVMYQYREGEEATTTIKLEAKSPDIPFYGLADLLELLGGQKKRLKNACRTWCIMRRDRFP